MLGRADASVRLVALFSESPTGLGFASVLSTGTLKLAKAVTFDF